MKLHVVSGKIQLPIKDMGHSPHTSGSLSPKKIQWEQSLESSLEEEDSEMGWVQVGKHSQQMCP